MVSFSPVKENVKEVVVALLRELNINVNKTTVSRVLETHPQYPSLLAISDALFEWKITNEVYRVREPKDFLCNIDEPFVAHFNQNGGKFILVRKITQNNVYYTDEVYTNVKISKEEFINHWDGIVLHAQNGGISGEEHYLENRIKYAFAKLVYPTAFLLAFYILYRAVSAVSFSWSYISLLGLNISGLVVTVLLLVQSMGYNHSVIQSLCGFGDNNTCSSLLKSAAAKLNSWLSWSEIGFFYFSGSMLAMLVAPDALSIFPFIATIALPFTLYSFGYQYRLKSWCMLCCMVQVILILQFLVGLKLGYATTWFSLLQSDGLILIVCFTLPVIIWILLRPFFASASELKAAVQHLNIFRHDADLFKQALANQSKCPQTDDLNAIVLGNSSANTVITLVTNPFCRPCASAHQALAALLAYRNDIKLEIVFNTLSTANDEKTRVARHLIAIATDEPDKIESALEYWFDGQNDYQRLADRYPRIPDEEAAVAVEIQKIWCENAQIAFTPTILLNGHKMPRGYGLKELRYFL